MRRVSNPGQCYWENMVGSHGGLKRCNKQVKPKDSNHVKFEHQIGDPIDCSISARTFHKLLQECRGTNDLISSRNVHNLIVRSGLETNMFLASHLIHMYSSIGSLAEANNLFLRISQANVFTWNIMMIAHVKQGQCSEAMQMFYKMWLTNVKPNGHIFVTSIKACHAAAEVKLIHGAVVYNGLDTGLYICNTLIHTYCKYHFYKDAYKIFDRMTLRDIVTWNSMLCACSQGFEFLEIIDRFFTVNDILEVNSATFVTILKACSNLGDIHRGKLIHGYTIEAAHQLDLNVVNTLIHMYVKCGSLIDAHSVFSKLQHRDVVTWSTLISGYAQQKSSNCAFDLFIMMQQQGVVPNEFTFVSILKAVPDREPVNLGRIVHSQIIEYGYEEDMDVLNTSVYMYGKRGFLEDAYLLFINRKREDTVTWCAIITSFSLYSHIDKTICLFNKMLQLGMAPDAVTFASMLKACANATALDQGNIFYYYIIESVFDADLYIVSTLIDMYMLCGCLQDASWVFERSSKQNVVTWSSIISRYAEHNKYVLALQYLERMQLTGLKPNKVTFVSLLSAAAETAFIEQSYFWLKSMKEDCNVQPTLYHYNCLVDALGHAGALNEAERLLKSLCLGTNIVGWRCLLMHCNVHGDVDLAQNCYDYIAKMNSEDIL